MVATVNDLHAGLRTIDQAIAELPYLEKRRQLLHLIKRREELGLEKCFVKLGARWLVNINQLGEYLTVKDG